MNNPLISDYPTLGCDLDLDPLMGPACGHAQTLWHEGPQSELLSWFRLTVDDDNGSWSSESYDSKTLSYQPCMDGDEDEPTCEGFLPKFPLYWLARWKAGHYKVRKCVSLGAGIIPIPHCVFQATKSHGYDA